MEIVRDIIQGSQEWDDLRTGSVGASSLSKIITSTGKMSSQRQAFLYQIAAEKLTGRKTETYSSQAMQDGIELEPQTRMEFQVETLKEVEQVGIIFPDGRPGFHISPDGLIVGEDAGLELKSVYAATQVKYLDKKKCPTEYVLQCQMSMFVTGYPIWWFCSHHPGLPLFYLPVERDEKLISIIKSELERFVSDVDALVVRLLA